jgi:multiple sugar transport system ATP-binding protein
MIYVTHDQVEAMTLADRVVVMHNGYIQQVGTPLGIYDWPVNRFVAGFLGTPSMNFVAGRLERRNGQLVFQLPATGAEIAMPARLRERLAPYAGGEMTLGVRPEDMGHRSEGRFAGEGNCLELVVRVVEMLGDEQVVHLEAPKAAGGPGDARPVQMVAKLDSHVKVRVDERFTAHLNMDKIHMFDNETERNVSLEPEHVASGA